MQQFHDAIFVIGAGAMAEAFIRGVTEQQAVSPDKIHVLNRSHSQRLADLADNYGITPARSIAEVAACRLIVLATKPADCATALGQAAPYLQGQLLVSLAAGVTIDFLHEAAQGKAAIVRTMPNIPVAVLEGVTAVAFQSSIQQRDRDDVLFLLRQIGDVVEIEEAMMDAVTAVSGSGPGFVCYFLEAMEEAAVKLGFTPQMARRLLLQTVVGTAKTLSEWGLTPRELRQRVTSPNGTTHAGVTQLEEGQVTAVVAGALQAAAARSAEMGRTYAADRR